jgi:hypothetical protein
MKVTKTCEYCSKKFTYDQGDHNRRRFCDKCKKLRREMYPSGYVKVRSNNIIMNDKKKYIMVWDQVNFEGY